MIVRILIMMSAQNSSKLLTIKGMTALLWTRVIRMHDHGVDYEFTCEVKEMNNLARIIGTVVKCLGDVLEESLKSSNAAQSRFAGQWTLEIDSFNRVPGRVSLSLQYENKSGGHSDHSQMIAREQLQGLSEDQAMSSGASVQFQIRRDAGVFNCEGWFREGKGSGHFVFVSDQGFVSELRRLGYEPPTDEQQFYLGIYDVSFALLEDLRAQGYKRSSIDLLVRMGAHGVTIDFIRDIGALGYRLGQVEKLIHMRDHGVTPDFIRELQSLGYRELSADQLVRARDHGVTPDFARAIHDLGYIGLSLENFIRMRDHGVTPQFVKGIKHAGFDNISAEELVRCRDHGVTAKYIRNLSSNGIRNLTIDQIIRLHDHGIDR
jgi:hypothetical protein